MSNKFCDITMIYFIKRLAINIILILIVNKFICDCNSIPPIVKLELTLREHADNDKMIKDEFGVFNLKPEIDGKLGSGTYSIVWITTLTIRDGTDDSNKENLKSTGRRIATKFAITDQSVEKELDIYTEFQANGNESIEAYGIPAVYYSGIVLNTYPTIGITLCEETLLERHKYNGPFSELNLLCAFYQALFTLKFMHEHGVIHQDLKPQNCMVRGDRLFLIDFNLSVKMTNPLRRLGGNRWYGSISYMFRINRFWMDDIKSLFYTMLKLADVDITWFKFKDNHNIMMRKLDYSAVRNLCIKTNPAYKILQRVLLFFYDKIMLETDPMLRELVQMDPRIPPYNEIGEEILKGIEELTENKSRDVLFKWNGEKSTNETMTTSKWIIDTFNKMAGGKHSQLANEEREKLEKLGLLSMAQQ